MTPRIRPLLAALVAGALGAAMLVLIVGFGSAPAPVAAAAPAAPAPVLAAPIAVVPPSAAAPTRTKPASRTTTSKRTPTTSKKPEATKCTDRVDYSNDPRDNATINSVGAEQGTCPSPMTVYREGDSADLVEDQHALRDANGETFYDYCARTGQSATDCDAG